MAHRAEGLNDIFEHDVIIRDNCTANKFIGDGSGLTGLPAGTELDPIFNAASSAIYASLALVDPHIADATIHFVDPGFLVAESDPIFNAASAAINSHIASSAIHYVNTGFLTAETDPTFQAASNAINTHIASLAIHYVNPGFLTVDTFQAASAAITASLALVDPHIANATIHFTSSALWASLSLINTEFQTASSALTTTVASYANHVADSSDPHGATLTQTYLQVASCAITADNTASGAGVCRNILIGTEASPGAASGWTQGTIYLKYTA